MTKQIQEYLAGMFAIEKASKEKQQSFFFAFEELIKQVTLDVIIANLEGELLSKFLMLMDSDEKGEAAFSFAKQHVPNLEQKIVEEVKKEIEVLQP